MIRISPRFSFPSFHHDFGTLARSQVDFQLIDRCSFLDSGCSTFFLVDAIREGTHARSDGRSNGAFQFFFVFSLVTTNFGPEPPVRSWLGTGAYFICVFFFRDFLSEATQSRGARHFHVFLILSFRA